MEVKVQDNQIENAIKSLKRQLARDGILKELKKRRSYEKPSVRKKRKQQERGGEGREQLAGFQDKEFFSTVPQQAVGKTNSSYAVGSRRPRVFLLLSGEGPFWRAERSPRRKRLQHL